MTASNSSGLCQFLHPTPPSLAKARRLAPGLLDVVRVDKVGHWIQHEARDRVTAELLNFLGARDAPQNTRGAV